MERNTEAAGRARDVIYQVSLLQGLAYGDYQGTVTVRELKRHGDTGLGTFDKLNGEMILLDGRVFRAAGDGSVEEVSEDETSPFSVVTFLDANLTRPLRELSDYDALQEELDRLAAKRGKNRFYTIRIDGLFREMNVRSVFPQKKPYRRLAEVLEQEQTFFHYNDVEGTVVGLYCPPYFSQLNAAGWHMHFLSKDKTKGGHVLGLQLAEATLTWDEANALQLQLPQSEAFSALDLTVDQSRDIEKIEKNR